MRAMTRKMIQRRGVPDASVGINKQGESETLIESVERLIAREEE